MGNCIKRKKRVVAERDNVTNNSSYYIQEKTKQTVEFGNNGPINSIPIDGKSQQISEFENYKMETRLLNSPPISGSMEHIRQKSHPLPTPNLQSQTLMQHHNNKASFLPLPKPDTSFKLDDAISLETTSLVPADQATTSSQTSILPIPITESEILSSPYLKAFSLDELRNATVNFCEDNLLGEGGFGCVFKGWLDMETLNATRQGSGLAVAIKKLIHSSFQGHKEWLSEVNYLGRLRHPNLVKLIGYCSDGEDRILVYEFMPGGSLEKHLFKRNAPSLSWTRRIKVAIGAARGLCFLHESNSPVIYRDFKTSNILLDSEFNAKLSDFGLAKSGPTESQTHVTTRVMGTEGYCDPRYLTTGKLTVKCDVYSFGVVLLELLTGRRAIDETKCEEEKNLVNWVKLHVHDNGKVFRIMDTKLEGQYCKRSAYVAANIALRCVHHEPKYRPPMTYILEILENLPSQKNHQF
ncbi:hypothetical protein BUALT_Bualt07G0059000 [Buddleja alternifolia]|uniref:non-specific serine/threonine protein kinase n=1 Tax=Buddleja alternifolia TaxID=168488 RepID=A0AAV6XGK2_9LAMI|nr:hypothetical protein BUALT_Bualt07G0059000 [Buddleja alternifolia]